MKKNFFWITCFVLLTLTIILGKFLVMNAPKSHAASAFSQSYIASASDGENVVNGSIAINFTSGCVTATVSAITSATDGQPLADIGIVGVLFENGKAIDTINGTLEGGDVANASSSCNPPDPTAYYSAHAVIDATFIDDGDLVEGVVSVVE